MRIVVNAGDIDSDGYLWTCATTVTPVACYKLDVTNNTIVLALNNVNFGGAANDFSFSPLDGKAYFVAQTSTFTVQSLDLPTCSSSCSPTSLYSFSASANFTTAPIGTFFDSLNNFYIVDSNGYVAVIFGLPSTSLTVQYFGNGTRKRERERERARYKDSIRFQEAN